MYWKQATPCSFVAVTYYFSTQGTALAFFSVLDPASAFSFCSLVVWTVAPFKNACMTRLFLCSADSWNIQSQPYTHKEKRYPNLKIRGGI